MSIITECIISPAEIRTPFGQSESRTNCCLVRFRAYSLIWVHYGQRKKICSNVSRVLSKSIFCILHCTQLLLMASFRGYFILLILWTREKLGNGKYIMDSGSNDPYTEICQHGKTQTMRGGVSLTKGIKKVYQSKLFDLICSSWRNLEMSPKSCKYKLLSCTISKSTVKLFGHYVTPVMWSHVGACAQTHAATTAMGKLGKKTCAPTHLCSVPDHGGSRVA